MNMTKGFRSVKKRSNSFKYRQVVASQSAIFKTMVWRIMIALLLVTSSSNALDDVDLGIFSSNQDNGIKLLGAAPFDNLGTSSSGVGDVNGDGINDFLVASSHASPLGRIGAGVVHLIFGQTGNMPSTEIDLESLSSEAIGMRIIGPATYAVLGRSVSGAGDVNGDGINDIILGAFGAEPLGRTVAGAAYVIFGHNSTVPFVEIDLQTFASDGVNGFQIFGAAALDYLGYSVSGAGDFNGDGFDDVIVGAPYAEALGGTDAGIAYIIFGHNATSPFSDLDMGSFVTSPQAGFRISGVSGSNLGWSVSGAGDVNDDGYDEVIIGAPLAATTTDSFHSGYRGGIVYVLFGRLSDSLAVSDIDASTFDSGALGFMIKGAFHNGQHGCSVSGAGDINKDGKADIIVAAQFGHTTGTFDHAAAFVYFGRTTSFTTIDMINSLPSATGFRITGRVSASSMTVAGAGDVNGDGFDDVIIGAPFTTAINDRPQAGEAYIVLGRSTASTVFGNIEYRHLTTMGNLGSIIRGATVYGAAGGDFVGSSVSAAGDINGDGVGDFVVGAPGVNGEHRDGAGAVYLIYGTSLPTTPSPSARPTNPTMAPSARPSAPSAKPTFNPTRSPTIKPTAKPVIAPTIKPSTLPSVMPTAFPTQVGYYPDIDLQSYPIAVQTGMEMLGAAAGDSLGTFVSAAGDVNADGWDDFIVGAYLADPLERSSAGIAYVILGKDPLSRPATLDLQSFTSGVDGYKILGAVAGDNLGAAVSGVGDLNGDGYADIVIGARSFDVVNRLNAGAIYIFLGRNDSASPFVDVDLLSFAPGIDGSHIVGASSGDELGSSASGAGDVNGDGYDDVLAGTGTDGKSVYVIFGRSDAVTPFGYFDLQGFSVLGAVGFRISGTSIGWLTYSVSGAGDVNGDGYDDIIVGGIHMAAPAISYAGASFVIFGRSTTAVPPAAIDLGTFVSGQDTGFRIVGAALGDQSGYSVSGAGDINGDGYDDVLVSAPLADPLGRNNAGIVYVLFGHHNETDFPEINLQSLPPSAGFHIYGGTVEDSLGKCVSAAGDVNADGYADIIVGSQNLSPFGRSFAGAAYVIFGGRSTTEEPFLDIDTAFLNDDTVHGYAIFGAFEGDGAGIAVSSAGDVNGDGLVDLIVGAIGADPLGRAEAGVTYILYGVPPGPSAVPTASPSNPTAIPSVAPTNPTAAPTALPTRAPSAHPTTRAPSRYPSRSPTVVPTTSPSVVFSYVDLATVTAGASGGTRIIGAAADSATGKVVSSAGDVNGDGIDDYIIVARPSNNWPKAYVIHGKLSNNSLEDLDLLNFSSGPDGFIIEGSIVNEDLGSAVSRAGDINDDGFDDILIGAQGHSSHGIVYVLLGYFATNYATVTGTFTTGTRGFKVIGTSAFGAGADLAAAGDVNGDGFDDFLVGSWEADPPGRTDAGAVFVIFGHTGTFADINLGSFTSSTALGYKIIGAYSEDYLGRSVGGAGDVNGDGYDDIVIGAYSADTPGRSNAGAAYVLFGRSNALPYGDVDLFSFVSGTAAGFRIDGENSFDKLGYACSGAGDINGDGYDDVLVSAYTANPLGREDAGAAYVIFGHSNETAFPGVMLHTLTASVGFRIIGEVEYWNTGTAVSSAGDVNGDGFGDILVGAVDSHPINRNYRSGAAYLIFGHRNTYPFLDIDLSLSYFDGTEVVKYYGARADDKAGAVCGAGDINSDGYDDIIIGAPGASSRNPWQREGAAYVIYGAPPAPSVAPSTHPTIAPSALPTAGAGDNAMKQRDLRGFESEPAVGFRIHHLTAVDTSGDAISSAGDLNGDGIDDIVIGVRNAAAGGRAVAGIAYVIFGDNSTTALQDIDLATFSAGPRGYRILGAQADSKGSWSVSGGGDLNGDGLHDVVISAPRENFDSCQDCGVVYVLYSTNRTVPPADVDLSTFTPGAQGYRVFGVAQDDYTGYSVSCAGDVNGDGLADVVVGSTQASAAGRVNAGTVHVLYGNASAEAREDIYLNSFTTGVTGFRILGSAAGDYCGFTVAVAADINGDGLADILLACSFASPSGRTRAGSVFVIFGRVLPYSADLDLQLLTTEQGFQISGSAADDWLGTSLKAAGDINGDGRQDIIVGARFANSGDKAKAGISYVIFGRSSGEAFANMDLLDFGASAAGFRILGANMEDSSGVSVSGVGDMNSDGFDDVLVGAHLADHYGRLNAGAAYVVFGQGSFPDIDLSDTVAVRGFKMLGAHSGDEVGIIVSDAGDVNSDGIADILVQSRKGGMHQAGVTYVIYGAIATPTSQPSNSPSTQPSRQPTAQPSSQPSRQPSHQPSTQPSAQPSCAPSRDAPPTVHFLKYMESGVEGAMFTGFDGLKATVSSIGDVNNDTIPDMLISTTSVAYVLFGRGADSSYESRVITSSTALGTDGYKIIGSSTRFRTGAGDVNGDGMNDILFLDQGATIVLYSKKCIDGCGDIEVSSFVTGSSGYKIVDFIAGHVAAAAGDINGDGIGDIIVGSRFTDWLGRTDCGVAYVIYGQRSPMRTTDVQLGSFVSGAEGFRIVGAIENAQLGFDVSGVGDVNGDGYDDVTVGEPNVLGGAVYVIYGTNGTFVRADIDLAPFIAGPDGFRIHGITTIDVGHHVWNIGDVNGDGLQDIGTYGAGGGRISVVFGFQTTQSYHRDVDIGSMESVGYGYTVFYPNGGSFSGTGDVNGDGVDDLIAYLDNSLPYARALEGAAHVIFGRPAHRPQVSVDLTGFASQNRGYLLVGTRSDRSGVSSTGVGDVNGDGIDDFLLGGVGKVFLVFGSMAAPTSQPSCAPSTQPTTSPTSQPSRQPTARPSAQPTIMPTGQPSRQPTSQPSMCPSSQPSSTPSSLPSAQPTYDPTAQPSQQPSKQPSSIPTSPPSSQPSMCPSSQPSSTPSSLPSAQPTYDPTAQPSQQPSSQPSSIPTSTPSSQPSMCPSSQPSSAPSSLPSAQPTYDPTAQPSQQPSKQPSSIPTSPPSSQPSMCPSNQPSSAPSSLPSAQPTYDPTAQPSQQPSKQPSSIPTSAPSSQPSMCPSSQPSSAPSSLPSAQPTYYPTVKPSQQPSTQPSMCPSSQPSSAPSSGPTGQPSVVPSGQPSLIPSTQPTSEPSAHPSSTPTRAPTGQPSAEPSFQPCLVPTSSPSSQPSTCPSSLPSAQPSVQPSALPTSRPSEGYESLTPNVSISTILPLRNEMRIALLLKGRVGGFVFCAALPRDFVPTSTSLIRNQGHFVFAQPGPAALNISGLLPFTQYSVYCTSMSAQGEESSLSDVLRTRKMTQTLCCKDVTVALLATQLNAGALIQRAVSIQLAELPDSDLNVRVSFSAESSSPPCAAFPESVRWTNRSTAVNTPLYIAVIAGGAGAHQLTVTLSGPAATAGYAVNYATQRTMTVTAQNSVPSVPVALQAIFSNNGSQVTVTFDSATNKGGHFSSFPCPALLNFTGAASATCQWVDSQTAVIYPTYSDESPTDVLRVDSEVRLLPDKVRAACASTSRDTECAQYTPMPTAVLLVLAPLAPVLPKVALSVPASLGGCSSFVADLTTSTGSAGRPWTSIQWRVLTTLGSTPAAKLLENYLIRNYTFSPPTMVPYTAFEKGYTYSIQATVCNFLGACASSVKSTTVQASTAALPVISILGQSRRTMVRSTALVLNSIAYTESCGGEPISTNLDYLWTISALLPNGSYKATALRSASQDRTVLRLPAFSLTVLTEYQVVLRVTSLLSGLHSEAAVIISVAQGGVFARIGGGSTRQLRIGDTPLRLDASRSFDEDVAGLFGTQAGLSFRWSCIQLQPDFRPTCLLTLPTTDSGLASAAIDVSATYLAANTTSLLTVTVSDSTTRSDSAQVTLRVTKALSPLLEITNSVESLTNVNTGKQLVLSASLQLYAPCTAAWSVDDFGLTLASISRTPPARSFVPNVQGSKSLFNLVVAENKLPQRATLVFSLSCGDTSTTVVATTNGAPLPGLFTVSPSSGEELSTPFRFTAVQWSDPDLPLTYQFGFESVATISNLVIVSKSELSYATATLPAGDSERAGNINCTLDVHDSLGAFSTARTAVVVRSVSAEAKEEALVTLISSGTGTTDSAKRIISVASAALNAVNCSSTLNCTSLNRAPCLKTSGECGPCRVGFIGDAGDRSTLCIPAIDVATNTSTVQPCTSPTDCAFSWQVCDPLVRLCSAPPKACSRNCSEHGSCIFMSKVSGQELRSCALDNVYCEAVCSCNPQYSGDFCEIGVATLRRKRDLRSQLISSLEGLTSAEDVNTATVSSWSASLYSLSINPHELSPSDLQHISAIANTTLQSALSLDVDSFGEIVGVLQATDTVASLLKYNYDQTDYTSSGGGSSGEGGGDTGGASSDALNNTAAAIVDVVGAFGDLVSRSMVLGQSASTFYYDNFRLSVHVESSAPSAEGIELISPQSDYEKLTAQSATAVSLTPSSSSGGQTGILSMKLLAVYPRSYSPDTSAFVSNPLLLQVQQNDVETTASPANYLSNIEFSFQNNEAQYQYLSSPAINFTTVCSMKNATERHSFVCPQSGHVLSHNCSRGAGVYTSYCPKPAPGCAKLDVNTADITFPNSCKVLRYNATYTTCLCTLSGAVSPARRHLRALSSTAEQDVFDDSGATSMMASTVFIANDFADTYSAADEFTSPNDALRVITVLVMLGVVWVPVLLLLFIGSLRLMWRSPETKVKPTVEESKQILMEYIDTVIPSIFQARTSWATQMWQEILQHHQLFCLFGSQTEKERRITLCKAATVLTFMLFLTAAFFDISNPGDDGTCAEYTTAAACLKRTSPFDGDQTYCIWDESEAGLVGEGECHYNTQAMTTTALFYMTVLTTLLTAIATIPLDYLFSTLNAPTATSLQGSKVMTAVTTVVQGARRLSTVGLAGQRVAPTPTPTPTPSPTANPEPTPTLTHPAPAVAARITPAPLSPVSATSADGGASPNRRSLMRASSFFAPLQTDGVMANREVSEDLLQAGEAARSSIDLVRVNCQTLSNGYNQSAVTLRARASVRQARMSQLNPASQLSESNNSKRSAVESRQANAVNASSKSVPRLSKDLINEVIDQRMLMNDQADETIVFDAQWGVRDCSVTDQAREAIENDVACAAKEASQLSAILPNYSVHHAGLEILHLFMVDLLGKNTPAAKIFQEKFGEEFGHSRVVVAAQKYAAAMLLLCLNAFFAYFIILKAFQKGYEWQLQYLACCAVQLVVEVFILESTECAWLNYFLPTVVREEVAAAAENLKAHVNKVTMPADQLRQSVSAEARAQGYFLNAPAHLFVSVRVAKALPHLFESMIVGSYKHHLPGDICRTWPHCGDEADRRQYGHVPRASLLSRALIWVYAANIRHLFTIPYMYQRIIMRVVQPIFLSGMSLVSYTAVQSIPALVVLSVFSAALLGYVVWRQYSAHHRALQEQNDATVVDAHAVTIEVKPVPTFIFHNDDEEDLQQQQQEGDWPGSISSESTDERSNNDCGSDGGGCGDDDNYEEDYNSQDDECAEALDDNDNEYDGSSVNTNELADLFSEIDNESAASEHSTDGDKPASSGDMESAPFPLSWNKSNSVVTQETASSAADELNDAELLVGGSEGSKGPAGWEEEGNESEGNSRN